MEEGSKSCVAGGEAHNSSSLSLIIMAVMARKLWGLKSMKTNDALIVF